MSRLFRPETLYFLLLWVAVLLVFRERGHVDPGSLWHVRVGELIFAHGLMHTDPFTFPFAGKPWVPMQWGTECLMALAHRAGGFDTTLLGFAVLIAGLFAGVFRRLAAGGMTYPLAGGVATFALVCAGFHFYVRPHMATIAFMAVTTALLVDFDRGRVGVRRLAWLVPLFVVWTNFHGGMLGGLGTLGLAAAGWLAVWHVAPAGGPIRSRATAWQVAAVTAVGGLTMFVNPFGSELPLTWYRLVGSRALARHVSEHSPLDLGHEPDKVLVAFAAFYLLLFLGTLPARPRVTWLLPLVWFALTVPSVRQGPLFVVVAVLVIADLWPHTVWYRLLRRAGDSLTRDPGTPLPPAGWRAVAVPAVVVATALGLQVARVEVPVVGSGWARFNPKAVPVDLTAPVRAYAESVPPGTPIYNDANFGGFLIFFAPELKIFMDDRFELCGDAWLENYVETIGKHPERFEEWYQRYGFKRALVAGGKTDPPLAKYLRESGKWREIARGEIAVLFERIEPFAVNGPIPNW